MSKRRGKKKMSRGETFFRIMLGLVALSMVFSLIVVALPEPNAPITPTPFPTFDFEAVPSATPTALELELPPTLTPTVAATEPDMGPVLPTDTPTATLTATPVSADLEFHFAVTGDSRNGPDIYRQVLEAVRGDGSEFLLHTGDLVNSGSETLWQEFQEIMADFELPFYPVAGNHDSLGGKLDGYLAYSGAPAAHYSFDRGPIHFALADSHNGGVGVNDLDWLREDLSATTQPIKMVVLHHPPFDPDGTDHIMAYGREEFMALMVEQEVDYVFAGHIHAYSQQERDGVTYIITGGAGAPLYSQDHPQSFYHYLRVTVRGETVTIEVVKIG